MNTTQNRSKVLAQFLRAATKELRESGLHGHFSRTEQRDNSLNSIDTVAEELETVAATPDLSRETIYRACAKIADEARYDDCDARQIRDRILAQMAATEGNGVANG